MKRSQQNAYLTMTIVACLNIFCLETSTVNSQETSKEDKIGLARDQAKNLALAFQYASSKMMPSVVTVLSKRKDVDETLEELDWLSEDSAQDYDLGSGVIISEDGLCVTNHHVVKFGKSIRVRFADGRTMMGTDLRSDPESDIAVFKIVSKEPLPAASLGDSDNLIIGDWVMAIGSPFSLDQTVSVGIISSKGRSMRRLLEGQLLQTDATINPGNSGGALLDLNGDLVGINTAIATTSGQFQGVGFAIPIRRVQWITKELAENGKVRRSKLGVRVERIPQDLADELKIGVQSGVYVARLVPEGPAEIGGILPGDIIQLVGEQRVPTPDDFRSIVEQLPADTSYQVKILRDGTSTTLTITPVVRDE